MRNSFFIAGAIVALMASGAMAQNQNPPAASGPQNPAISGSTSKQVDAPVKGRNSFTEGEAKSRIEKDGLSNVSGLTKDDNGVWRGKAMKDGRQVDVSLDYQGNIVVAR
jgi:opacity protein-like surface antigen